MNSIKNNPYRTLGLLAGASVREISRQANRLQRFISAEQEPPTDDNSFPVLGGLTRSTDSIEEASSKLNLESDKMNAALFWFWKGNSITDEVAFEELKEGNIEEAYKIWDKLITVTDEDGKRYWRQVSEKNNSAFHNVFVLDMLRTNGNKLNAIVANLNFLESEFSQKFISTIVDSTHKTNSKELQIIFLNEVLRETEQGIINIALSQFVSILNKKSFIAKVDFLKSVSQKIIDKISSQIKIAENKRKSNVANAIKTGEELYQQTKNDLEQLKSVVGLQDFNYSNTADKVANEILQCSIDFFNYCQDINSNNDYHSMAMIIATMANGIAIGNLTKERIKDSIETLEKMKDREILQAIDLLKSVKDAYEKNEATIMAQVRVQEASLPWGHSINWSKVDEVIKDSIDWDKVLELIKQVIPIRNIDKIKVVKDQTKINEYKSLVNFVTSKLSYWKKKEVQYLDYWSTVSIPVSSTQTRSGSGSTSSGSTLTSTNSNRKENQTTNTQDTEDHNTENILFVISIIIWILMISFVDEIDGTWMAGILYASFVLFAMWYTPIIIIVKIIRFFKNNK